METKTEAEFDEFMTVREVAHRLRIHEYTVYKLLSSGRLQGTRIKRRWRISRVSFDKFVSRNQILSKEKQE